MRKLLILWIFLLACLAGPANAGFLLNPYQSFPAGGLPGYSIDFESGSAQSLSISDANWGVFNKAKWSYSVWYKKESIGVGQELIGQHEGDGTLLAFQIYFDSSSKMNFITTINGSTVNGALTTNTAYTDTSAYHHWKFDYDSANATAGDRMRISYDGTEVTSFLTDTNPSAAIYDSASNVQIGGPTSGAGYLDGLIYQAAFFSGTIPAIGTVYNAGSPVDVTGSTGLWSVLNTEGASPITDGVLVPNWTNNNSVTTSVIIP